MTPVEILKDMAQTYADRQEQYGEAYLVIGKVMKMLYPDGIVLTTEDGFNKYHLFDQIVAKVCRYAGSGGTHVDSIHDIAVYAAMLEDMITRGK